MIPIGPGIFLRPATPDDEPFQRRLFDDVRGSAFAGLGEAARPLLDMQYRARQLGYDAQFPSLETFVILSGDEPVGALMVSIQEETRLVDLSLIAEHRGRGIGSAVLRHYIELGKDTVLQVAHGNPAIRLYQRLGFILVLDDGMDITMCRSREG